MNTKSKVLSVLAAGALFGSLQAADDALVSTLAKNGFITQAQAEAIMSESKGSSDKVFVEAKRDTTASVKAKARFHWQFGYATLDSDYEDANTEDYSTFETRRVRFGFEGKMTAPWEYDIFLDIDTDGATMDTAELIYTGIDSVDIGFGYTDLEVGKEESTSSSSIKTVERSLLANTFDGPDSIGLWADAGVGPVSVYAGLFNGEDEPDNALEGDGSTEFAANFQVFLDLGEVVDGIDGEIGFQTNQFFESDNADYDGVYSLNGELEFGMFGIQADYAWAEDAAGDTTQGFMVMPYVEIVDNLELVFRFDYIESDAANGIGVLSRYVGRSALDDAKAEDTDAEEADNGDEYTSFYLGANYYLAGNNLKVMAGVEFSELEDTIENEATAMESTTFYTAVRARF